MIVGLLITPAALAYLLTDRLPRMMAWAAVMGVVSVVMGLYFSEWVNASGGGSIMFMGFLLFIAGLVAAPRYGLLAAWMRRRRLVPQADLEDVLRSAHEGCFHLADVPMDPGLARRAVRQLGREGLLEPVALRKGQICLTDKGREEAAHIMRSHQLWEGHLIRSGMSAEAAHRAAHELEHLHYRDVLIDFDAELEHPVEDADGTPIPPAGSGG